MPNSARQSIPPEVTRLVVRVALIGFSAAVLAAGFSLTMKNEYRARAVLLVSPSPVRDILPVKTFAPTRLDVIDYELLLTSDPIVASLRDRLVAFAEERDERPKIRLEDMRKNLEVKTRIGKQTMDELVYQPVIELYVDTNYPEMSAELANMWADASVRLVTDLTQKRTEGTVDFLSEQYLSAKARFDAIEQAIETFESENDIEGMQNRLKGLQELSLEFQLDTMRLTREIASDEARVKALQEARSRVPRFINMLNTVPDASFWVNLTDNGEAEIPKVAEFIEAEATKSQQRLDQAAEKLRSFEKDFNITGMQERLISMQAIETEFQLDRVRVATEVASSEAEVAKLQEVLASMSEKITVRKALPDEAFWLMPAEAGKEDKALVSEEVNLAYGEVRKMLAGKEGGLAGQRKKLETSEQQLKEIGEQRAALQTLLAEKKAESQDLQRDYDLAQEVQKRLATSVEAIRLAAADQLPSLRLASGGANELYATLETDETIQSAELAGLKEKTRSSNEQMGKLSAEVEELEKEIAAAKRTKSMLMRQWEAMGKIHDSLMSAQEEAMVSAAENTPDLKIASQAAVPETKTGPHRSLLVVSAAILASFATLAHYMVLSLVRQHGDRIGRLLSGAPAP